MAVPFYMNFQKDVSSLVVSKYSTDGTSDFMSYALDSLPNYLSINVDSDITISAPLLFLQYPDCYCFESVDPSTGSAFDYDAGTFLNPETVVYRDINSVYLYAGLAVPPPASVPLPSLNGNGSEFMDGDPVSALGRPDIEFNVVRSFYQIYADNAYQVVYDLESINGHKLSCPEALLSKPIVSIAP